MVEGTGTNADKDFVGAEMRLIDIGVVQYAGITVLMKDDGFHERPPGTGTTWSGKTGRHIVSRYVGGA
jgi:hypothetical protein